MKITYSLLFLLPLSACLNDAPDEPLPDNRSELVRTVENAHLKDNFLGRETVSFDLEVNWRGQSPLRATIHQRTDGTRIRMHRQNGDDILFDGNERWFVSSGQKFHDARFDLFAWHYFFCLPWKLSDPGVRWQPLPDRVFEDISCTAGHLTFAPGTGDSANDWFVVFSDKKEGLLRGALYVVTFGGKAVESAEKEPRSIVYSDFRRVDGIPIAHAWKFYGWHTDSLGNRVELGSAAIYNVRFTDEQPEDFAVPSNATKI